MRPRNGSDGLAHRQHSTREVAGGQEGHCGHLDGTRKGYQGAAEAGAF